MVARNMSLCCLLLTLSACMRHRSERKFCPVMLIGPIRSPELEERRSAYSRKRFICCLFVFLRGDLIHHTTAQDYSLKSMYPLYRPTSAFRLILTQILF